MMVVSISLHTGSFVLVCDDDLEDEGIEREEEPEECGLYCACEPLDE